MYERMLDRNNEPSMDEIKAYIGEPGCGLLAKLEDYLRSHYELARELRFPFGKSYGWGFKYSHKTKHLCYLFFEKGAITVTIQIGDGDVPKLSKLLDGFLPKTKRLWEERYPCGKAGGWMHYRVFSEGELADVIGIISVKKKPLQC